MGTARWRVLAVVGSLVIGGSLIACSVSPHTTATGAGGITSDTSASPSPTPAAPSPTPVPTHTPVHTTTVIPTTTPSTISPTPGACPTTEKGTTSQSPKQILALLTAASKINEYEAADVDPSTLDSALGGKLPNVHIPLNMLKAIAADESSWTSNCVSSDGLGFGTMQMEQDTADLTNQKFQTGLNRFDPNQNIKLGNAYLEYLTVHFGILFFHNDFDLAKNLPLRDAVIAAYNVGIAGVDQNGKLLIGPAGTAYYQTIVALMNPAQACQKTWGR